MPLCALRCPRNHGDWQTTVIQFRGRRVNGRMSSKVAFAQGCVDAFQPPWDFTNSLNGKRRNNTNSLLQVVPDPDTYFTRQGLLESAYLSESAVVYAGGLSQNTKTGVQDTNISPGWAYYEDEPEQARLWDESLCLDWERFSRVFCLLFYLLVDFFWSLKLYSNKFKGIILWSIAN